MNHMLKHRASLTRLIAVLVIAAAAAACATSYGGSAPAAASPSQASLVPSAATGGDSTAIEIKDLAFNPATVNVPSGSRVTWTNGDATAHTVTFDDASADSGNLEPRSSFDHTFVGAGTFAYHCSIHSFMHGTVMATP